MSVNVNCIYYVLMYIMYLNKRVELIQREIALQKIIICMYVCMYVRMYVLLLLLSLVVVVVVVLIFYCCCCRRCCYDYLVNLLTYCYDYYFTKQSLDFVSTSDIQ